MVVVRPFKVVQSCRFTRLKPRTTFLIFELFGLVLRVVEGINSAKNPSHSSGWYLEVLHHPGVSEFLRMKLLNALMRQPVEPEAIFTL
jgi:hypothetical protein